MIGQPAAGVSVNCAEQRLQSIEKSDHPNSRAEHLEVLWDEPDPQPFPSARQNQRSEQQNGVAPQSEEVGNLAGDAHSEKIPGSNLQHPEKSRSQTPGRPDCRWN